MRTPKVIYTLLFLFSASLLWANSSLETAASQVNAHWLARNNASILQIIEDRLTEDSGDVFALCLKYHYYFYADIDLAKSRSAADQLVSSVAGIGNDSLDTFVGELKTRVYSVPLSESTPFTAAEVDAIHAIFKNSFPGIDTCLKLATRVEALESE